MADRRYFLGVDGGGTHCRVRIRDDHGEIVATAEGGLANVYQDFDRAVATIQKAATEAAQRAGIRLDQIYAGMGLAGVMSEATARAVESSGFGFAQVSVVGDGHAACLGAHGGRDGGIIIAGTGSGGFVIARGKASAIGSMGFELGDQASGAIIGRAALRRAVLALDAMAEETPMLTSILKGFERNHGRMLAWSGAALSRDYAAYAPAVFEAARIGDAHASEIIGRAGLDAGRLIQALLDRGATHVALIGSVAAALRPWYPQHLLPVIVDPEADPADGAIILARQKAGLPSTIG